MKTLKKLLLTKARMLFWLWYLPGVVWLIWMSATRPDWKVAPLFLFMVWVVLGLLGHQPLRRSDAPARPAGLGRGL